MRYVRMIAPANNALVRFRDKISSLGNEPARPDVAKAATALIAAIQTVDKDLVRAPWPPAVERDIEAEVVADLAITADLSVAGALPNWEGQLKADESTERADARIVRADLHLPHA